MVKNMKIKIDTNLIKISLKNKIKLAICIVVILSVIGGIVHAIKYFSNTEAGLNAKCKKEIGDYLDLTEAKKLIKVIKEDVNKDGIEDYYVLIGEPKYEQTDTSKVKIFKSLSSTIEMYNNVAIKFVDGASKKVYTKETNKTFSASINMEDIVYNDVCYVNVSDDSGEVAIVYFNAQNDRLSNVVSRTVGDKQLLGYTIEAKFLDGDNSSKIEVVLDNYGVDYIDKKEGTITLDYSDNTNVTKDNYRLTYMSNKYSNFNFETSEDGSKLYLKCTQNILYSNGNNEINKNEGFVVVKFVITDECKLKYESTDVIK